MKCSYVAVLAFLLLAAPLSVACGDEPAPAPSPAAAPGKAASAPTPTPAPAGKSSEVVIGAALPLTGAGANFGKREHAGAQVAVDHLNAAGGINGQKVKLAVMDTGSNPQEAVNAVKKLASEQAALAIVGLHYNSEAEATFPLGNQLKIAQLSVASTKAGLAKANRPWAFRNTTGEPAAMDAVAAKLARLGIKSVAVIADMKDSTGRSLGNDVIPASANAAGLNLLTGNKPESFVSGDASFSTQVANIKKLNPDAVGLGALAADAARIIAESRRQGITARFFAGSPVIDGELEKKGGKEVEGIVAGATWYPGNPSAENDRFVADYADRAPSLYPGLSPEPSLYAANSYDAVNMVAEAIAKNGVTTAFADLDNDRDRIRQYLSTLKSFKGVGSRGFDPDGEGIKDIHVLEIKDGSWAPLP